MMQTALFSMADQLLNTPLSRHTALPLSLLHRQVLLEDYFGSRFPAGSRAHQSFKETGAHRYCPLRAIQIWSVQWHFHRMAVTLHLHHMTQQSGFGIQRQE